MATNLQQHAIEIWNAGVAAVHGRTLVEKAIRLSGDQLIIAEHTFDLAKFDSIVVVGGGKFSHYMAQGVESVLGPELAIQKKLSGLITVPDDSNQHAPLQHIESAECRPAGINLPTPRVLQATQRMIELLAGCDNRTLVLALISGGGSALIEHSTLPLDDVIAATQWLSLRGADIIELNSVRIAMSDVKGGGLARAMERGTMAGLIVSDVPGDDIRFVSSGPTVEFQGDIFAAAQNVIAKFDAATSADFPNSVIDFLSRSRPPTNKAQHSIFNALIGNADAALVASSAKARELGYEIVADPLAGASTCQTIAVAVTRWISEPATALQCAISLGEPIVEPGDNAGLGGRNQHAVLETSRALLSCNSANNENDFCFLSAGTDGEDGNTPVAGALVTRKMLPSLNAASADIEKHLTAFDSHPFLQRQGMLFESGPTATNVADLRVLLRTTQERLL